jgi:hypothetical protein
MPRSIDSLNKWSTPSRTWRRNAVIEENILNTSSLADCTRSKDRFIESLVFRMISMLADSLYIVLPFHPAGNMSYYTLLLCILDKMWDITSNCSTILINVDVLIIHYLGLARLSCSGNINSAQTNTIPTIIPIMRTLDFQSRMRICL